MFYQYDNKHNNENTYLTDRISSYIKFFVIRVVLFGINKNDSSLFSDDLLSNIFSWLSDHNILVHN